MFKITVIFIGLLFATKGFAMSPFTQDARVIEAAFRSDDGIWKEISGPIKSIRIFDRLPSEPDGKMTGFSVEIKTGSTGAGKEKIKGQKGTFAIKAEWDFLALKSVTVKKIKVIDN